MQGISNLQARIDAVMAAHHVTLLWLLQSGAEGWVRPWCACTCKAGPRACCPEAGGSLLVMHSVLTRCCNAGS